MTHITRLERWLLVSILALSLLLRLSALDQFVTSDEDNWHRRSIRFADALAHREWHATFQSGHPGVVTMWVGAAARSIPLLQQPIAWPAPVRSALRAPESALGTGLPPLTLGARRVLATVTWLAILGLCALLFKLFAPRTALLASIFVSLDPFLLAHSRLHHLDAILTVFMALSIVSLLVYQLRGRRIGYLLLSGACAALAMANKSPGLFLVPWAGLVLASELVLDRSQPLRARLRRVAPAAILWSASLVAALFVIWPALWVDAAGTIEQVLGSARGYAENPHQYSNFFWFAARPDPGIAFYPLAWAFRATPWVLLGVFALPLALAGRTQRPEFDWRAPADLVLAVLGFGLFMTLGAKKFDRYLLPIFPLVDALAALGWVALLGKWQSLRAAFRGRGLAIAISVMALAQAAFVLPTRPYYLSFYNPLLGGGRAASKILLVGWGEGLDRAAAYLNTKPDAADLYVGSWHEPEFDAFFLGHTLRADLNTPLAEPDYYVFYRNILQRGLVAAADQLVGTAEPEFIVSANGIDYALVYPNDLYTEAASRVLAYVDEHADAEHDVLLFDVNAAAARHYAGALPVERVSGPAREDWVRMALARIMRAHSPEQPIRLWHIAFADSADGISAIVRDLLDGHASLEDELGVDGVHTGCYALMPGAEFIPETPQHPLNAQFGHDITLLGYDLPEAALAPGDTLRLRLYWRAERAQDISYTVFVHLLDGDGQKRAQIDNEPQGRHMPTTTWSPGEIVLDDYLLEIPADAPVGQYSITLGMYDYYSERQRLAIRDAEGAEMPDAALTLPGPQVERSPEAVAAATELLSGGRS